MNKETNKNIKLIPFKLENFKPEELQKLEEEVNAFTTTHNVIDVKITSCCNSFGWLMMYVVLYTDN